jgi:hypothetical protein
MIAPNETKQQREEGLCMNCRDGRHFAAACPGKLKVVLGQI